MQLIKQTKKREEEEDTEKTYIDRFSSKNDELLSTQHKKTHKTIDQQLIEIIHLLDFDRDANRIDRTLDKSLFVLRSRKKNWLQHEFLGSPTLQSKKGITFMYLYIHNNQKPNITSTPHFESRTPIKEEKKSIVEKVEETLQVPLSYQSESFSHTLTHSVPSLTLQRTRYK